MAIPHDKKELEEVLRKFFDIDRCLPRVKPSDPKSLIGKMIVIPDTERSIEDINEDMERKRTITMEDIELWIAANKWICLIASKAIREVVIKRCQGKGWKRIAGEMAKEGISKRYLHRTTLWRNFNDGLDEILRKISQ